MGRRRKKKAEKAEISEEVIAESAEEKADEASEVSKVAETTDAEVPVADETAGEADVEAVLTAEESEAEEEISDNSCEQVNTETTAVDAFLSSLDEIKAEDIDPSLSGKKKKKSKLSMALLIIFGTIFLVSAFLIGSNILEGFSAKNLYNDMNKEFFADSDRTGNIPYLSASVLDTAMPKYGNPREVNNDIDYRIIDTNNPAFEEFKVKLAELKEQNPDVYGWIQVDGTNISYPCVKGVDNVFYLDHTATKEYNGNGAIFADSKCADSVLDNPNLVFYGHNSIYPGQMFHELSLFLDEAFFRENRYVTIYTMDGVYTYEIFAIYETSASYRYCQVSFVSDNSFVNWSYEMKSNSLYFRDISDFTSKSRVLTLSTCTNGYFTRRYSLQAKLIQVEK